VLLDTSGSVSTNTVYAIWYTVYTVYAVYSIA